MRLRNTICTCLLIAATTGHAEQDTLDYFYTPQVGFDHQPLVNRVVIHARNTEWDHALSISKVLIEESEKLQQSNPKAYSQMLINHGIVLAAAEQYDDALVMLDQGLEIMEEEVSPFSEELINGIMAKALTQMGLEMPTEAEDSFRRAQHITHRSGGVYTEDQLVMLNYLTATSLQQGDPIGADTQQLFSLKVAEQVYGPDSKAILPTLSRLGSYFASRGSTIPVMAPTEVRMLRDSLFKHSINMYDRALLIIEQNYGAGDKRMIPHLRGMASARLLQVTARHRAEEALLRSLEIIQNQPDVGVIDQAQAYIDLGDLYIITSDEKAAEHYLTAWNMLQENQETQDVAQSLFGVPVRLYPRSRPVFYLDRVPDAADGDTELFVDLEYNITENGRVRDIRVIEKNVPNEKVRVLRQSVRAVRYRPRIEAGEIVATEGLRLHQLFKVFGGTGTADELPAEDDAGEDSTLADDELS